MKIKIILILLCLPLMSRAQSLIKAEYFFDNDPGVGKATTLTLSSKQIIDQAFEVATDGLEPGKHILCIRVKDDSGIWSTYHSQWVLIREEPATAKVTSAEYFFDNDPGVGNATKLPLPAGEVADQAFEVVTDGLDPGKHTLYIRVTDGKGVWSHYHHQTVLINEKPGNVNITTAEYFIDKDPGFGKGTPITLTPGPDISGSFEGMENISYGRHVMFVRVRDAAGRWSLAARAPFNRVAASFTFTVDGNQVFYDNHSDSVATGFQWIFGDSKEGVQVNPRHTFEEPGGYQTCLIAFRGSTSDTLCQEVGIRGIQSVSPAYGGSTGPALLTLKGYGFQEGSSAKLVGMGSEIKAQNNTFLSIYKMEAYFRLDKVPQGVYDLVVSHPSKPADTLRKAFSVQPSVQPEIWVDIIGPDRVLINRPTRYSIAYGNRGNTLAVGVPVFIGISADRKAKLLTPMSEENVLPEIQEALPESGFFMARDSLSGDSVLFTALVLPAITPGTTGYIDLEITSGTMDSFDIDVKTGSPMFAPERLSDIGLRTTADCNFIPPCINCLLDFISFIPGAGCAVGVLNLGCAINNGINKTGPRGGAGALNLIGNIASTALGCVPAVKTAGLALRVAADAAGAGSTIGSMGGSNSCGPGGCNPSSGDRKEPRTVGSLDPNIKEGPAGLTDQNYILDDNIFHYTIYFENKGTASAPASEVLITDQLDTALLDLATMKFTGFGFGDSVYTLEGKSFATDIDLRPARNIILRVSGNLNEKGILSWRFTSFDPETMGLTEEFWEGFLPPNKNAPEGEGYVAFSIRPKSGLPHLEVIENKAEIFFDLNDPIETPVWVNTIDRQQPESGVRPITTMLNDTAFIVEWDGQDNHAGLSTYTVYVSEDGETFVPWLVSTANDSAVFHGRMGHAYRFYSVAFDWAGNKEQKTAKTEAEVIISTLTAVTPKEELQEVKLFPNPSKGTVHLLFENKAWGKATISVYNSMGQLVKSHTVTRAGPVSLQLDHPGGVYLIHLDNGRQRLLRKLILHP